MKHLSILALVFATACPLFAQAPQNDFWTDLSVVAYANKIDLIIDYSDADVLGEEFADFVADKADEWPSAEAEIRAKFIRAFNEEANDGPYPHRLGSYPSSEYRLVVKVTRVADRGSDVNADILILNAEDRVVFSHRMNGDEGEVGSVLNLMGDAMEDMGESLGKKFYWFARNARNNMNWW